MSWFQPETEESLMRVAVQSIRRRLQIADTVPDAMIEERLRELQGADVDDIDDLIKELELEVQGLENSSQTGA